MKISILFTLVIFTLTISSQMQYTQYFDGADTTSNSLEITIGSEINNIWQIGKPQKNIFTSAATVPNALVTDTINNTPVNNTSSFSITTDISNFNGNILAFQWRQKLDMDYLNEVGKIEYSMDNGSNWTNAWDDPYVYNFYGFQTANMEYTNLVDNPAGFTGQDTNWRDIWFCLDPYYLSQFTDTVDIKFTFISDSVETFKNGWMIDNFTVHETWVHTISESDNINMKVYPSITKSKVFIEVKRADEFHIIELIELINMNGEVTKSWANLPVKFFIDISDKPSGSYILKVKTNREEESFKIIKE